jgi:predicted metalloendopeptidase
VSATIRLLVDFGERISMLPVRTAALVALFACALAMSAAPADQNTTTQDGTPDVDRSIKAGDDFYRYANGGWLRTAAIPAGQSSLRYSRNFSGKNQPASPRSHSAGGRVRRQIKTDIHSPGEYRSDPVRNVGAWYKAFDITPGDKLYLNPEDRVEIW